MKAEHYIKSGLNGIPASVMRLADCVALATGELEIGNWSLEAERKEINQPTTSSPDHHVAVTPGHQSLANGPFTAAGHVLPSQNDFSITAEAFVTDTPITLLGFVNRESGVIEEPGHPADGQSMAGKIAIFPKGSGSTVAPYVLLELFYRGKAPLAIVNTEIDQQSAPACSLENIPYAYQFDKDIVGNINHGDTVSLKRVGHLVTIDVIARHKV
jgi:predicted aconitase with swiveling domain